MKHKVFIECLLTIFMVIVILIWPLDRKAQALEDNFSDVFTYASDGSWLMQMSDGAGNLKPAAANVPWSQGWTAKPAKLNQDNSTDMVLYNKTTGQWAKAINNGNNGFTYYYGSWAAGWDVYILDLSGDGLSDVFGYNSSTGWWNQCFNSSLVNFSCISAPQAWDPNWQVNPARLNSDAFDDILVYNSTSGLWFKAFTNGSGGFSYTSGTWPTARLTYPADFNNDGLTDFLLYNSASGAWTMAQNDGSSSFTAMHGQWDPGWTITMGDFDSNDYADAFLYKPATGQWVVAINNSTSSFSAFITNYSGTWDANWQVHVADYNADEWSDLLLYNFSTGVWVSALNTGVGNFSLRSGQWNSSLSILTHYTQTTSTANYSVLTLGSPPPEILSFSTSTQSIPRGQSVILSWTVANATKVTLNPGGIDVTALSSYAVTPQSNTLYNLRAESGSMQDTETVFVRTPSGMPDRLTTLWVGPWYDRTDHINIGQNSVQALRTDFGAKAILYGLDWLDSGFEYPAANPSYSKYREFCNARIAEASANNTYLFFMTTLPFDSGKTTAQKQEALNQLGPCFTSPWVLGIMDIDETALGNIQQGSPIPDSVREGYNLFKQTYPDKLVWHNDVPPGNWLGTPITLEQIKSVTWADIVSFDQYPIYQQSEMTCAQIENFFPTGAVTTFASSYDLLKNLANGRDAWFINQARNYPSAGRAPTPNELQCMADLTWNKGLQGLSWWGMNQKNLTAEQRARWTDIHDFFPSEPFKAQLREINGNSAPVAVPLLGDLNLDHIVNSLDWSYMNSKWFTNDATADLDHNGIVNSLDFSVMNSNWFKTW